MTPVELLREAARVMREQANAATYRGRTRWTTSNTQMTKSPVVVDDTEEPTVVIETFAERYEDVNAHLAAFGSPAVALAVADWLDREARRIGSHAITAHQVRENWWAYQCVTCGVGGSTSEAGLAAWQDAHSNARPVADDAALAVARAYLGGVA